LHRSFAPLQTGIGRVQQPIRKSSLMGAHASLPYSFPLLHDGPTLALLLEGRSVLIFFSQMFC